ncbi:DUF1801 domain-containing protein [Chryseobacterium potabilaquae]|uniref:YdhG-like domain-containing protein n=1 Tax=Chryseobacterium potabilaquae TaxID=2675057 RepID=A0A6N4XBX2_9FLAO|nr:DUF1801 domain-containing protein [Chryseobacterium potabilaquae]CAA7197248.1 hypothetical protein CHRY9293_03301 [Chryseobacterium potabilaquae]
MNLEIQQYNTAQTESDQIICLKLFEIIDAYLTNAESKIWHSHPVWFLDGNPIVDYSKQKKGIRLMFWSGKSFEEDLLNVPGEKFQDASVFYNDIAEINEDAIKRCLKKSENIQWDYKNIIKRKGELIRIKK